MKTLKIGAHKYKIRFVEGLDKLGVTDRVKGEMIFEKKLLQSQFNATLMHEILHACNNEIDHALLDSLAEQLTQVFNDNDLWRMK